MSKNSALLVVSFGTSHEESRKNTIDVIEQDLASAFPGRRFYRAWTSRMILKKLREENGVCYDNPEQSFERMIKDGIKNVLIQPTYMMAGVEFEKLTDTISSYRDNFDEIKIGAPLFTDEHDIKELARAIEEIFADIKDTDLLALMGHGSKQMVFPAYTLLNEQLKRDGHTNICVGTLDHEPGIAPVLERVRERNPEIVYLTPLLVVAGAHAVSDMSSGSPNSWKNQIENENTEVRCIIKGMGEYKQVRDIYIRHAQHAQQRKI